MIGADFIDVSEMYEERDSINRSSVSNASEHVSKDIVDRHGMEDDERTEFNRPKEILRHHRREDLIHHLLCPH